MVLLELMREVLVKLLPFWRDCFFRAFSSLWTSGFAKDTCSVTLCVLTGHFTTDRLVIIKSEQHVDRFLTEMASRTCTVVVSMEILYSKNPHRVVTAIACEQALLFGRVKRVSRERAPRSRVLARLASLAKIGELARRLYQQHCLTSDNTIKYFPKLYQYYTLTPPPTLPNTAHTYHQHCSTISNYYQLY